ncbi:hypothetical protein SprV_0100290100 [Sparganum proliferum]
MTKEAVVAYVFFEFWIAEFVGFFSSPKCCLPSLTGLCAPPRLPPSSSSSSSSSPSSSSSSSTSSSIFSTNYLPASLSLFKPP